MRDLRLEECPVSYVTPRSSTLVRLWMKAERRKTTLSDMLGQDEAWIEDVQETLDNAQDHVKHLYEVDRNKRG